MDSDGYFYITDRKKDLIKTKDYSVYPRELEDILYEHPAVKLCAVVGKPDQMAGEVPKAYIVLKERATVSAEEIMAFINNKVAPLQSNPRSRIQKRTTSQPRRKSFEATTARKTMTTLLSSKL